MDGLVHDSDSGNRTSHDDSQLRDVRSVSVDQLIQQYTPLVKRCAYLLGFYAEDHFHHGMEIEDAIQAGYIGLIKARENFDPSKTTGLNDPFTAYAKTRVMQEILDEVKRNRWFSGKMEESMKCRPYHRVKPSDDKVGPSAQFLVINQEWIDKIENAVPSLKVEDRNLYQDVMRHDGQGKAGNGTKWCEEWGYSPQTLSARRHDIRSKLRKALH